VRRAAEGAAPPAAALLLAMQQLLTIHHACLLHGCSQPLHQNIYKTFTSVATLKHSALCAGLFEWSMKYQQDGTSSSEAKELDPDKKEW
jgi:hypothetical protein